MNGRSQLVVFYLDDQPYALRLAATARVISAVHVTRLPNAPPVVSGVVNFQGEVIPVFDIRRRFGLREQPIAPDKQFIVAHTATRTVAIVADGARGVVERSEDDVIPAGQLPRGVGYLEGVAKFDDGLILIHDLDKFLSLEEERELGEALEASPR